MKGFMTTVFILFAVIAVGIGYANYRRLADKWEVCTAKTQGVVVDFKSETSMSSSSKILFPIVQYYVDGKGYQVTSGSGTNRQKLKKGQDVTILYNPDNPLQIRIQGYNRKGTMYFCMAIMAMGVVIPVFCIRFIWKH